MLRMGFPAELADDALPTDADDGLSMAADAVPEEAEEIVVEEE